jgi:hypothetical protein
VYSCSDWGSRHLRNVCNHVHDTRSSQPQVHLNTKGRGGGGYESNAFCFFSQIIITFISKFTYIMGTSLTKLRLFFPKSLLHYQHTFSTFTWDSVCRSRKTFCWSIRAPHARYFSSSSSEKGVLGVHPSRGQKYGSQKVLNRDCWEDEWEQSTALLQLPPLWATGVGSGFVMQEEDLIHLPVQPNPSNSLFLLI